MERMEDLIINQKAIGDRIKKLRKEQKIKVTDISDAMGFETPQAVYKWQRGNCLPEISNLILLSRMLGTTVEDIILGDEERSSSRIYWYYNQLIYCTMFLENTTVLTNN